MDVHVQAIADLSREHSLRVAVAESLTSGALASRLGAGPEAAEWFRGGIVAYGPSVKFNVLEVTPGPLVTQRCAWEMAEGAARLLGADVAIGVTGLGGPGPREGKAPGTVIMAVTVWGVRSCRCFHFPGDPEDVIAATVDQAVSMVAATIRTCFTKTQHDPDTRRPG